VVGKGVPIFKVTEMAITEEILRMKTSIPNEKGDLLDDLEKRMYESFGMLEATLR
jgi:hypothetical protein